MQNDQLKNKGKRLNYCEVTLISIQDHSTKKNITE